jgi:excinuclease ABC subunit B
VTVTTERPATLTRPDDSVFEVISEFAPAGDQPSAIKALTEKVNAGEKHVVLHGATGTGKSATTAWLIEQLNRPTLVLAPNKTLAAQLAAELRELLPNNAVTYFVSHFAYYRPEAYVPSTDTYIEKDSAVDDEVERLRHEATASLFARRDAVVVASVSAIYGLGRPAEYKRRCVELEVGNELDRDAFMRELVDMGYARNDVALERSRFRVRGDTIDVLAPSAVTALRVEFFGDEVDAITHVHPVTGDVLSRPEKALVFPATHHVAAPEAFESALATIRAEFEVQYAALLAGGKLLEAQRLKARTDADLEALETTGMCKGIENYSRHFDLRQPGEPPSCLLHYFPEDFVTVIDESHVTVPQLAAMYEGDQSRKRVLVEHGFRLPSALDNRPLKGDEFWSTVGQTVYLSATPGPWEYDHAESDFVEQVIRPTGLVDPEVVVRPVLHQVDDLLAEVLDRKSRNQRSLITTLTKRMAEQMSDYLLEAGLAVRYLHSDVSTVDRIETLRDLRLGTLDVVVGVNLLREGLDLPEVSFVAVLDADKEGFLRSTTSLIQTIGRAARHPEGRVVLYADRVTRSMAAAMDETNRRRAIQVAFNVANGVEPRALHKKIVDVVASARGLDASMAATNKPKSAGGAREDLVAMATRLEAAMKEAAAGLRFEEAGALRDELLMVRREVSDLDEAIKASR